MTTEEMRAAKARLTRIQRAIWIFDLAAVFVLGALVGWIACTLIVEP